MPIVNHAQVISIYRMVLDRLPFVIDDSLDIYDLAITGVDQPNKKITVSGDYSTKLWINQIHTVVETAAQLVVKSWVYNSGPNTTVIEYVTLSVGEATIGQTLHIEANWNEQLISRYIYQLMIQLQPCFQISPDTDVGDEAVYTQLMKMVIAELVCWYILFRQSLINAEGDPTNPITPAPPTRYISSAKAGEVATNWAYIKLSDTGKASIDAKGMMAAFKENAVCLARQLGCDIEVCEDGAISCSCSNNASPVVTNPFFVANPLKKCNPKGFL
jgi:hypothetical protein